MTIYTICVCAICTTNPTSGSCKPSSLSRAVLPQDIDNVQLDLRLQFSVNLGMYLYITKYDHRGENHAYLLE